MIDPYSEWDEEFWKNIRGFPDYTISNFGEVYSWLTHRVLRPRPSGWGYLQVILRQDNVSHTKTIHRLVAEHFVPGWDDGLDVNHIDGDKTNNHETNLEWVTRGENNQHAIDLGLRKPRGRRVLNVDTNEIYPSLVECARDLDGTVGGLMYVLTGRSESGLYKGVRLRYANDSS